MVGDAELLKQELVRYYNGQGAEGVKPPVVHHDNNNPLDNTLANLKLTVRKS